MISENQRTVLELVEKGHPYYGVPSSDERKGAGRRRTLYSLEERGLIEHRLEHWGHFWRLTDAGRKVASRRV